MTHEALTGPGALRQGRSDDSPGAPAQSQRRRHRHRGTPERAVVNVDGP